VRIDGTQLEALKHLARTSEGRLLHSVLAADQQATMKSLIQASAENVQRLQGRAVLLDEILKVLDSETG